VVDESLTGVDIKGKNGTSTTASVNGTLTGADISGQAANPSVGQPFVDGSLTTADTKNNTLTGADINESTLATVPSADKVDGLDAAELDYRSTVADETFDPVLSIGGLVLKARCHAVGAGFTVAEMRASTLSNDADIMRDSHFAQRRWHPPRKPGWRLRCRRPARCPARKWRGFSIATLVYSANGGIKVTVTLHASLLKESQGPPNCRAACSAAPRSRHFQRRCSPPFLERPAFVGAYIPAL
jgi:hypothetical protein